ncbi:MAG: XisH family protein [Cyanobacteria bacterium CAN_BIN43]|nr:XisH family protein [Cyanobacteria bacterium CAN_BIN43]
MPAKDLFHDTVKHALEKEGWDITREDYHLEYGGVEVYIDLVAEQLITAERQGQKIAVEVKSFVKASNISEFHSALGQFINYRTVLRYREPERVLYLAIPSEVYESFFQLELIKVVVKEQQIKLLSYDPDREVIEQWIE